MIIACTQVTRTGSTGPRIIETCRSPDRTPCKHVATTTEWILLGTVLLVLGSLIGYWFYEKRNLIEALEQHQLQVQARVIDENLGRQMERANNALADTQRKLHATS